MDFEISLSTDSLVVNRLPDLAPDPVESILEALRSKVTELGCPNCCSGFPLTFVKESANFGGGGTIIGNGYKLEQLTRITADLVLAEGGNGSGINIGELPIGQPSGAKEFMRPASAALLVGSKEAMKNIEALESMLRHPAPDNPQLDEQLSSQLKEKLRSANAIGFGEFPLVLRTNDPLIT
jgi:hypothetical protein